MFKLDDNFLAELGPSNLPSEEKKTMLGHSYETLELRVGMKLAQNMTASQREEFEVLMNAGDEAGGLKWLETNVPTYKDVVAAELDTLKDEVKASAPTILAASQEQTA